MRETTQQRSGEDFDLIEAARAGRQSAFRTLVERHSTFAFACAFALTRSASMSEEIAQEAFLAAWRRLPQMLPPYHFRGWLFGIIRNTSLYLQRTERTHRPSHIRSLAREEQVEANDPSPLDQAITSEEILALGRALEGVPERYRVPLLLHYGEQQSIAEVARVLGLTDNNVRQRLLRGRRMLQDKVGFVEASLAKMRPRRGFAVGVMAALLAPAASREAEAAPDEPTRSVRRRFSPQSRALLAGAGAVTLVALVGTVALVGVGKWPGGQPGERGSSGLQAGVAPTALRTAEFARLAPPETPAVTQVAAEAPPSRGSVIFNFDLEDGILPPVFELGALSPGPPGTPSRFCVVGNVSLTWPTSYSITVVPQETPFFLYSDAAVLSFDLWIGDDTYETEEIARFRNSIHNPVLDKDGDYSASPAPVAVSIRDLKRSLNDAFYVRQYTPETWNHVDIPLSSFKPAKGRPRAQGGDPMGYIGITGGRAGGKPFYVDNLKLVSTLLPAD